MRRAGWARCFVITLLGLADGAVSSAQGASTAPGGVSVVVGAGSVNPAPYWQGGWSTWGPARATKTPEVSAAVRLALDHGKSIEFGVSRWRVQLSTGYSDPFSGYSESRIETQEVRALEVNWLKRLGARRAAFFAGGGLAISAERNHSHVTTRGCAACEEYDHTDRHLAAAIGQGLAGLDVGLTKRLRASVAYRVQARNVGGFEFGGWYHGITAAAAIAIR